MDSWMIGLILVSLVVQTSNIPVKFNMIFNAAKNKGELIYSADASSGILECKLKSNQSSPKPMQKPKPTTTTSKPPSNDYDEEEDPPEEDYNKSPEDDGQEIDEHQVKYFKNSNLDLLIVSTKTVLADMVTRREIHHPACLVVGKSIPVCRKNDLWRMNAIGVIPILQTYEYKFNKNETDASIDTYSSNNYDQLKLQSVDFVIESNQTAHNRSTIGPIIIDARSEAVIVESSKPLLDLEESKMTTQTAPLNISDASRNEQITVKSIRNSFGKRTTATKFVTETLPVTKVEKYYDDETTVSILAENCLSIDNTVPICPTFTYPPSVPLRHTESNAEGGIYKKPTLQEAVHQSVNHVYDAVSSILAKKNFTQELLLKKKFGNEGGSRRQPAPVIEVHDESRDVEYVAQPLVYKKKYSIL